MKPRIASTALPPVRTSHNETYLSAFIERARLQGWTDEQIDRWVKAYNTKTTKS